MAFSDSIKKAIDSCGLTRYRIAAEAGVPPSSISRFMSGQFALTTDTLDKIAPVIGLEVRCRGARKELLRKPRRK